VRLVSGVEHHLAVSQDSLGLPKVNHGRVGKPMPEWRCSRLHHWKLLAKSAAVFDRAEAIREFRAVLHVRNWLSEYGLSSDT
jgi:hypothetical protein